MPDIDFYTFGISSNDPLLERINRALDERYAFGDFDLRSAWLYYGDLQTAADALGISFSLYQAALSRPQYTKGKGIAFDSMSETLRSLLYDGANMMEEMSDSELRGLFPFNQRPQIVKETFINRVQTWRTNRPLGLVTLSVSLVERYKRVWRYRSHPRVVFESAVSDPLKTVLGFVSALEDKAAESKLCSVALEIIGEYQTYRWHREKVSEHKKKERKILDRKRSFFFEALVLRDGKKCVSCGLTRMLRIDHRHPLSRGGFTEMENLQLLCFSCNSKKSNKTPPHLDVIGTPESKPSYH